MKKASVQNHILRQVTNDAMLTQAIAVIGRYVTLDKSAVHLARQLWGEVHRGSLIWSETVFSDIFGEHPPDWRSLDPQRVASALTLITSGCNGAGDTMTLDAFHRCLLRPTSLYRGLDDFAEQDENECPICLNTLDGEPSVSLEDIMVRELDPKDTGAAFKRRIHKECMREYCRSQGLSVVRDPLGMSEPIHCDESLWGTYSKKREARKSRHRTKRKMFHRIMDGILVGDLQVILPFLLVIVLLAFIAATPEDRKMIAGFGNFVGTVFQKLLNSFDTIL